MGDYSAVGRRSGALQHASVTAKRQGCQPGRLQAAKCRCEDQGETLENFILKFFLRVVDAKIDIERDGGGKIVAQALHQNGVDHRVPRSWR